MASYYGYSANVRRAGASSIGMPARPSAIPPDQSTGTDSSSQGYSSTFGYGRWINLTGNYAKSNGIGLITSAGILPVNLPPLLPRT